MRKKLTAALERPGVRVSRFSAMTLGARASLIFLVFIGLTAVFAPLLATHNPEYIAVKGIAPNSEFYFGTDHLGRDVFSRLLYGGRYSLAVGLFATGIALALGAVIGSVAAVARKSISETIMRLLDIVMSIPGIALAAVLVLLSLIHI